MSLRWPGCLLFCWGLSGMSLLSHCSSAPGLSGRKETDNIWITNMSLTPCEKKCTKKDSGLFIYFLFDFFLSISYFLLTKTKRNCSQFLSSLWIFAGFFTPLRWLSEYFWLADKLRHAGSLIMKTIITGKTFIAGERWVCIQISIWTCWIDSCRKGLWSGNKTRAVLQHEVPPTPQQLKGSEVHMTAKVVLQTQQFANGVNTNLSKQQSRLWKNEKGSMRKVPYFRYNRGLQHSRAAAYLHRCE